MNLHDILYISFLSTAMGGFCWDLQGKIGKVLDNSNKNRYNTKACVCGHILAPDGVGGLKSKRRCKQHG